MVVIQLVGYWLRFFLCSSLDIIMDSLSKDSSRPFVQALVRSLIEAYVCFFGMHAVKSGSLLLF